MSDFFLLFNTSLLISLDVVLIWILSLFRFIEDKSYSEIEEQLLISQDTIRQRISRALKKLKDILNP